MLAHVIFHNAEPDGKDWRLSSWSAAILWSVWHLERGCYI